MNRVGDSVSGVSMVLKARSIGEAILPILQARGRAQVHSIFKRSVNCITMRKTLITLATKEVGRLPYGILVDLPTGVHFNTVGFKEGMLVQMSRTALVIPDVRFRVLLDAAQRWTGQPEGTSPLLPIRKLQANIACAGAVAKTQGPMDGLRQLLWYRKAMIMNSPLNIALNPLAQLAFHPLAKLINGFRSQNVGEIREAATPLIGLGVGLTPSADDVLVGLMGGLYYLAWHMGHAQDIARMNRQVSDLAEGKTTLISQTLLQYAARGELTEKLRVLVEALLTASEPEVTAAASEVLSVGSTSGTELILGVLLGLETGLELFTRETA